MGGANDRKARPFSRRAGFRQAFLFICMIASSLIILQPPAEANTAYCSRLAQTKFLACKQSSGMPWTQPKQDNCVRQGTGEFDQCSAKRDMITDRLYSRHDQQSYWVVVNTVGQDEVCEKLSLREQSENLVGAEKGHPLSLVSCPADVVDGYRNGHDDGTEISPVVKTLFALWCGMNNGMCYGRFELANGLQVCASTRDVPGLDHDGRRNRNDLLTSKFDSCPEAVKRSYAKLLRENAKTDAAASFEQKLPQGVTTSPDSAHSDLNLGSFGSLFGPPVPPQAPQQVHPPRAPQPGQQQAVPGAIKSGNSNNPASTITGRELGTPPSQNGAVHLDPITPTPGPSATPAPNRATPAPAPTPPQGQAPGPSPMTPRQSAAAQGSGPGPGGIKLDGESVGENADLSGVRTKVLQLRSKPAENN